MSRVVERSDNRRPELLAVAARLFAKGGFEATSMRDIAGEVGMLAGSMYYHFPSKNELIAAVYQSGVTQIGMAVDAALAGATEPWARLEAACIAHLESLLSDSAHAAVMLADLGRLDPRLRRRLVVMRDGYERRFRALVASLPLSADIDRSLWRLHLLGALNWTPTWYRPGGKQPAAIARALVAARRSNGSQ
jgi:AcrR family transcriptional regulator